jgi:hypothetical protein
MLRAIITFGIILVLWPHAAISLVVLASASAHAYEATASSGAGGHPTVSHADAQTITICW